MANNANQSQKSPMQQIAKTTSNLITNVTTSTSYRNVLVTSVTSEDSKIVTQIQSTHSHEARQVDVKPVLDVIEDIFSRAHLTTLSDLLDTTNEPEAVEALVEKMGGAASGRKGTMLEELAIAIQKVCCEFTCKCTAGDAHASTMSILKVLGNYSWDAKVVIATAAFAVTYGELWLVTTLDHTNPLARSIAALKQTPERNEINGVLKPKFGALEELAKIIVDVAKSLIEFRVLPSKYISPEDAPLATSLNHIVSATYWTIRCIVACGAQLVNIGITSGLVSSPTEAWDLSSLAHKEKSIHDQLVQRLTLCYEFIEERKKEEAYKNLVLLFQTTPKDNVKILKSLIYNKTDIYPLVEVSSKKRVGSPTHTNIISSVVGLITAPLHHDHHEQTEYQFKQVQIDVLRGKTVLLFISDLDVSEEEIAMLDRMYRESRRSKSELQYEIVWLPIVDRTTVTWTSEHENRFKELQYKMSWYTLFHPSLLDEVSLKFIKQVWGFAKKHIVVSLDHVGKVVSTNALHMILIWGNAAYPFTSVKEEELWKKQTWKIDFVVNGIHPDIPKWIAQGDTHICLFGGEDIEWIRKFTTSMKEHATKTVGLKLELVYVGKHNAKEAVRKIMTVIKSENLAHTLPDLTHVWYFWSRLESMLYSKMIHGKNVENDNIVKEVMSVMSFDGGDQGWGFIGKGGSDQIVKGKGDMILSSVSKHREWEESSKKVGFLVALWEHLKPQFQTHTHHCNRLVLPAIEGAGAPRVVACADCGRPMDKYILYRCCTG